MSDLPTVGAEEEFLLVDPRTGEPAPRTHRWRRKPSAAASHSSWN